MTPRARDAALRRLEMVQAVAAKYRCDQLHAAHVAELADTLFDAFLPLHGLPDEYREMLRHAALLHDIGYFVAAKAHHRHGAYLIMCDETLQAYPEDLRDFLARAVRNHRRRARTAPAQWPRDRRDALLWLSGMLRLADALDYDHQQRAEIASVGSRSHGFEIVLRGLDPRQLGARLGRKAQLLEDMTGGALRFREEAS